jgi:hypothetical protein
MTPDELDEAILDLSEADYDELECMALDYCMDHKNFTRGNDFQKGIMLQSAMRMMMKEQITSESNVSPVI